MCRSLLFPLFGGRHTECGLPLLSIFPSTVAILPYRVVRSSPRGLTDKEMNYDVSSEHVPGAAALLAAPPETPMAEIGDLASLLPGRTAAQNALWIENPLSDSSAPRNGSWWPTSRARPRSP